MVSCGKEKGVCQVAAWQTPIARKVQHMKVQIVSSKVQIEVDLCPRLILMVLLFMATAF